MAKYKINQDGITATDLDSGKTINVSDLKKYTVIGGGNTGVPIAAPQKQKATTVGGKILNTATDITKFLGGGAVADTFGATAAKIGKSKQEKDIISQDQPSVKQTIGSGLQLGANFIPGAGEGLGLAAKVGIGAATGYAYDVGSKLQNKDTSVGESLTPGVGTAIGGALPIAGAVLRPAAKIVGRLLKGLGSGLSGVSTDTINKIIENPEYAKEATRRLQKSGNYTVLEDNAKQIVNGISQIRQEARGAYGTGLEQLSKEDINPSTFREKTQAVLDKYGISKQNGVRKLSGVEFDDPKNIQKASHLIDKLHNTELDGKSLRKLSDDIESAKYKTATSDERLSFNHFLNDVSSSLKDAVNSSTGKLDEINKNFSQDMGLSQAAEKIFGKVNYKNLSEVVGASQKLESLFQQKGIAPEVVDKFLSRIGINPEDFKTGEAVRQISNKTEGSNSVGTSFGEVMRSATSAVITPKTVRNLATFTGLSRNTLSSLWPRLSTGARAILLNAIVQQNSQSQPEGSEKTQLPGAPKMP